MLWYRLRRPNAWEGILRFIWGMEEGYDLSQWMNAINKTLGYDHNWIMDDQGQSLPV